MEPTKTSHIINGIDINAIDKHPNILIAASFWEKDRYHAAKVCYRFMRKIDDMVDDRKSRNETISCMEQQLMTEKVRKWIDCLDGAPSDDPELLELLETIKTYKIPLLYFHNFTVAMQYDISNSSFPTFQSFIEYAEGASVAPAAIFVHLCCLKKEGGAFNLPQMDILEVARPCAIFSYLVHIIRDFQKDQLENLNYFSRDIMEKYGISLDTLKDIANGGEIPDSFRKLVGFYVDQAEVYKQKTLEQLRSIETQVNGRYLMSLQLIFKLYLSVFNRIDVEHGSFTSKELNPSNEELGAMVLSL